MQQDFRDNLRDPQKRAIYQDMHAQVGRMVEADLLFRLILSSF